MKKPAATSPSAMIDARIKELGDWRGTMLARVRRLIQRREATGSLRPLTPRRPDTRKLDDDDLVRLRGLIADRPDMTLGELAEALGHKASVPTVWRATRALGLPLKKRRRTPASRTGPMSKRRGTTGSRGSRR